MLQLVSAAGESPQAFVRAKKLVLKPFKGDSRHVLGYFHPSGQGLLVFFCFILTQERS